LWVCLLKYPIATLGSVLFARIYSDQMNLDHFDAVVGWCASALLASAVWYTLEPWVQRLWGARPPTERQWLRLKAGPVPRGLAVRRPGQRVIRGVPLIRTPRTLPRIIEPGDVNLLLAALRTQRDQAMVLAMLLGGLRRCEVLGLRFQDLQPGERRVLIADGKGGHQRLIPISTRFFTNLASYIADERPQTTSDHVFVVLKRPHRGQPLTPAGLDEIVRGARQRAGLPVLTCHQLRHTCLTRLREAGMALEALQAQAGHRSIESTRIYIHLANGWLAEELCGLPSGIRSQ